MECDDGNGGYRLARVSWSEFKSDLVPCEKEIGRDHLINVLRHYFKLKGIQLTGSIFRIEDERLVSTLSMICPFEVSEKQALLESTDLVSRAEL